jgi:hypothetical protein
MSRKPPLIGFALALSLAAAACTSNAYAATLITPQEAALPRPGDVSRSSTQSQGAAGWGDNRGGTGRDPDIRLDAPKSPQVASPFPLRLMFVPHGGSHIDPASITVTYLKSPAVDLTGRLKPYTSARGIDMEQAEAPPGEHAIRVEVSDDAGRTTATVLHLTVAGR